MLVGDLYQMFCSEMKPLNQPFVRDGWRYFTDGRVLVRRPVPGVPDDQQLQRVPKKPAEIMAGIEAATEWKPWPKLAVCGGCRGEKWMSSRCPDCRGTGDCRLCGEGPCHECDGTGKAEDRCNSCDIACTELEGARISRHYVWLIGQLGDVEWTPREGGGVVLFRWPEGQGAAAQLE